MIPIFNFILTACLLAAMEVAAKPTVLKPTPVDFSQLKAFGTVGKEVTPLSQDQEAELFRHEGKGCLTHMWFGGGWKGCERTRIRVYVDGETNASIDMELYLGHGIGFGDEFSPWGVARIGKIGTARAGFLDKFCERAINSAYQVYLPLQLSESRL